MRPEQLTVNLRARTAWEAIELGLALVRRHAGAVWKPWVLVTLPVFVLLNALAWSIDTLWLAGLVMWWLKPVFDRIPLYVLSRAVFGATPSVRETLRAQLRWGWRWMPHYLSWRRLSPVRSLYLPIDLLEGVSGAQLRERRRVLGSAVYGNAALLTLVCLHFEFALVVACYAAVLMFVPFDYLPETARAAWSMLSVQPPWWAQMGQNAFVWLATSVIEPFYVGAGFGLYLNRRTQLEAWDIEIAFRKLRARLAAAATPFVLALALLGASALPLRAQEAGQEAHTAGQVTEDEAPLPPTLPKVFGEHRVDDGDFREAADRAYEDPLLGGTLTREVWEKRNKSEAPEPEEKPFDNAFLKAFSMIFALIGEWGLWLLALLLVIALLATVRHWWPWMQGSLKRSAPRVTEVREESLELPDVLPDDIPGTARRMWKEGRQRQALALLYRASVEAMSVRAGVVLPPGATESECLRASRKIPDEAGRGLFARMVRVWQYAAYAGQVPVTDEFESLLAELQAGYGWPA